MITVSLCMIVKDEQDTVAHCLESVVDIMDEIIIVDTGSSDDTKKTCARFTDNIHDFEWIDDFSAARNFSFAHATKDYVMWLDADDVLLEDDREKLIRFKMEMDPSVDSVMMKYNVGFDASGNITLSYYRERMVKRQLNSQWHEPVHEYLDINGKTIYTDIAVTHKKKPEKITDRNIRIYESLVASGKELSPRGQYYYVRELYYHERFPDAIQYLIKFLDGKQGWVEDNIAACIMLSECLSRTGDAQAAMRAALRSFEYDLPRAEICCQLGWLYFIGGVYEKAVFWYKLAMSLPKPEIGLGFVQHDYYGYIPCMQLCVCYDRMGRIEEARSFNEIAARYKPNDNAVEFNRRYFNKLSAEKTI